MSGDCIEHYFKAIKVLIWEVFFGWGWAGGGRRGELEQLMYAFSAVTCFAV